MVDIQSPTAVIRQGKRRRKKERKKGRRKIEITVAKYNGLPITMGGHHYYVR